MTTSTVKAHAQAGSETAAFARTQRAFLVALVLAVLFAQTRGQTQSTDALPYSKGYPVTGDFVVGGVDLVAKTAVGGFVTGTISIAGVPDNADVLEAFLYWETIWTNPNQLNGATF